MKDSNNSLLLSIIIVTYNSGNIIGDCLKSIYELNLTFKYEIIVVDNNSNDNTIKIVSSFSDIKIIRNPVNLGFAYANNLGFKNSNGYFILILNPDIILTKNINLDLMMKNMMGNNDWGILAPCLFYESGQSQESYRSFPTPLSLLIRGLNLSKLPYFSKKYRKYLMLDIEINGPTEVDWVIGAFMLMRSRDFKKADLFDENYFMYYEDADLCVKMQKLRLKIIYDPQFTSIHKYKRESAGKIFSNLKIIHIISIIKFFMNNYGFIKNRKQ